MTASPANALIDAVRAHLDGQAVDVDKALTAFAGAVAGTAADDDLQQVREATGEVLSRYRWWLDRDGQATAKKMAAMPFPQLIAAVDRAVAPFPQLPELLAARAELEGAEDAAQKALEELNAAIEAVDVDTVMRLRGEVEVGNPGRIAAARRRVLELEVERAEAQLKPSTARNFAAGTAVMNADKKRAAAEQALRIAEAEFEARKAEQAGIHQVQTELARSIKERRAALAEMEATEREDAKARLRRIAGLPEPIEA